MRSTTGGDRRSRSTCALARIAGGNWPTGAPCWPAPRSSLPFSAPRLQAIDWDGVADAHHGRQRAPGRPARSRAAFSFPLLAAAAALIVLIGLGAFFWTRTGVRRGAGEDPGRLSLTAATHLRSGLAREEMISYLRQSQLMLTDLLQDCAGDDTPAWEINLYSRQAKELLVKKKYFRQNLPAVDWLGPVRSFCFRTFPGQRDKKSIPFQRPV